MRRLRQGAQASRTDRPHDLAGFRGGAAAARADYWAIRRVPRDASLGLEDLPGALRQQQVLGRPSKSKIDETFTPLFGNRVLQIVDVGCAVLVPAGSRQCGACRA